MKYDKNKSLVENAIAGVDITEPELPDEIDLTTSDFTMSEELADRLSEEINDYLAEKYGLCVESYGWELKLTEINWDTSL